MAERTMSGREREMPVYRPLKVYAFDPTQGHNLGNDMTINVPYEKLAPGPVGEYLAVIDYDATNKCYYQPIDLDDPRVLLRGGWTLVSRTRDFTSRWYMLWRARLFGVSNSP